MNSLAFNMHISQVLRGKYLYGLAVFPFGLMFSSFLIFVPFAYWLLSYLGIPEGELMMNHPNGIIWLVIVLAAMVTLMISGYILGWFLNAMVARVFLGWNAEKTHRVFLYSEVPNEWVKKGKKLTDSINTVNEKWAITRQKGKWSYIIKKGVLGWGVFMFFFMTIIPMRKGSEHTYFYFIWQALLWAASGGLFGCISWYFSEKQYMKKNNIMKP